MARCSALPPPELRLLAVGRAVAKELLFRAARVPTIGIGTTLVFGALHFSGRATYVSRMLWATVMGVLLGKLFVFSGSLLPPLLAHALINHENMRYLCRARGCPRAPSRLAHMTRRHADCKRWGEGATVVVLDARCPCFYPGS